VTRTILVTGGAGFIGSALVRQLIAAGDRVRVLDDLSMGSRHYLDALEVDFIEGSLADAALVRAAVAGADGIVHLAARAGIVDSIANPHATFDVNVLQTVQLLEAARVSHVRRFVMASSNAVLGRAEPPFDEQATAHPLTPYGASKLAGEAYCQAYAASFGMAACALRFSNVYGPRSLHKKSVIAAWLRSIRDGRPIVVYGSGEQTRDFVYVDDIAVAIRSALDAEAAAVSGEVIQIGTGRETTVNELADALGRACERPVEVQHAPSRAGDPRRNVGRIQKARLPGSGLAARWPPRHGLLVRGRPRGPGPGRDPTARGVGS
jgi:UDP-glucose 4-epimerase